jgi:hypothetical protein
MVADALSGSAAFVEGAAALVDGVQVISQVRSHQQGRVDQRADQGAAYCATPPGTPQQLRIRGGEAGAGLVGRARMDVCAHQTNRVLMALKYADADP